MYHQTVAGVFYAWSSRRVAGWRMNRWRGFAYAERHLLNNFITSGYRSSQRDKMWESSWSDWGAVVWVGWAAKWSSVVIELYMYNP